MLQETTDKVQLRLVRLAPQPAFSVNPQSWYVLLKDAMDTVLSLGLLLLSAPVILLAGLLVKLTSAGPVFYSQIRVGRQGRLFRIYKIRTMRHNCESLTGPQWSGPGDWRITPVGGFLRRTHIDELPQLWNVLKRDMSLIGPRPERPEFVDRLDAVVPLYRERLLVRPGITGLAQLHLPPDTDLKSVRRKLAYDLYYIRMLNFWLDFRILITTGFQFLGAPSRLFCWMLRLPRGEKVERAYLDVAADALPKPDLQPVYV